VLRGSIRIFNFENVDEGDYKFFNVLALFLVYKMIEVYISNSKSSDMFARISSLFMSLVYSIGFFFYMDFLHFDSVG
jgi:hypothetical protein